MSFSEYLYEVGGQLHISESGTTEITEKRSYLRKLTPTQVKSHVGNSFRKLEKLTRQVEKKQGDDKIEVLSQQINELGKILGILISMKLKE